MKKVELKIQDLEERIAPSLVAAMVDPSQVASPAGGPGLPTTDVLVDVHAEVAPVITLV